MIRHARPALVAARRRLGRGIWRAREAMGRLVEIRSVVLLQKALAPGVPDHPRFDLLEIREDAPIVGLYRDQGREFAEERIRLRLARGLRFYVLRQGGRIVATTFLVVSGDRFVDELGRAFAVPEGALWVRDIFVDPGRRGEGLFGVLLDTVVARLFPGAGEVWSDVLAGNTPSLRAHARYGFERRGTVRVLHVGRRVLLRLGEPRRLPAGNAYRAGERLSWTGEAYRRFIDDRMA